MSDRTLKPPRSAAKALAEVLYQDIQTTTGQTQNELGRLAGIFETLGFRADTTHTFTRRELQLAIDHTRAALTHPYRKRSKVERERLEGLLRLFGAEVAATTGETGVTSHESIKLSATESRRLTQPLREWHRTHPSAKQPFTAIIQRLDHIGGGAGHKSLLVPVDRVALFQEALRTIARNPRHDATIHRTARHVLTLLRQREAARAANPLLSVRFNQDQLAYLEQAVTHYAKDVDDVCGAKTIIEDAIAYMKQTGHVSR